MIQDMVMLTLTAVFTDWAALLKMLLLIYVS